jgi:hypothetical protein
MAWFLLFLAGYPYRESRRAPCPDSNPINSARRDICDIYDLARTLIMPRALVLASPERP